MSILLFVIGYTTDNASRILCEVDTTIEVNIELNGLFHCKQTISSGKPDIIVLERLNSNTRYNIRIYTLSDERIGSFKTSPSKLHFLSCNNYSKGNHRTWQYMISLPLPDMICHIGDIIYLDYGNDTYDRACKLNTYELMVENIRADYRRQYNISHFKKVLSNCSNVMLFDDHCGAVDSFDQKISLPHDWMNKSWNELLAQYVDKEAKAIIAGLQCVCEYLLSLCGIDKPRSWSITVAGKRIGFVETRISRAANLRLVFPKCDILVTGVPIFMLPNSISNDFTNKIGRLFKIYDIYDQWNLHQLNMEDVISQIPDVQMLIAGDTHAGAKTTVTLNNRLIRLYITSGIDTPTPPKLLQRVLQLFRRYTHRSSKGNVSIQHEYWIWHNNYLKVDMNNLEDARFVVPALLI